MDYKDINDYEVLYLIGEDQSEYKDIIFNKYKPMLNKFTNFYYSKIKNKSVSYEDIYQEALIALNYAVDHFDFSKTNTFQTYAYLCINSRLKCYVDSIFKIKNKTLNDSISFETLDFFDSNHFSCNCFMADDICFYDRINDFKNNLEVKKAMIFELKCNGFSNMEISQLLDIPKKTVYENMCLIRKRFLRSNIV